MYALLFLAFWTAWIVFTLYANVAHENTHVRTAPAAMFGMAVMAAAVPGGTRATTSTRACSRSPTS